MYKNNFINKQFLFILSIIWTFPIIPSVLEGTLLKTPNGLVSVETISPNDILIGYSGNIPLTHVSVLQISSTLVNYSIVITTSLGKIHTTPNQLFYVIEDNYDSLRYKWIAAQDLAKDAYFLNSQLRVHKCLTIEHVPIPPTHAYNISTTHPHNFFAHEQEFLVHNFFPFLGLGATFLFGGELEFAGLNFVTSIAGIVFGVTLFKKRNKTDNSIHITSTTNAYSSGNGKKPNDDDDKDKKDNKERKCNDIDKTTFFKKIKNQYEHSS